MKSKEFKVYNLPIDRIKLAYIDAKPIDGFFVLLFLGFLIVALKQYVWGAALILFSLFGFFILPNRPLVEFYDKYLVLFNHANKTICEMIYYEDVKRWSYSSGLSYDTLSIVLVDDSTHSIDGYSKIKFESYMNKYLKDKKEKSKKRRSKGV